jgi:hypothetical protein
MARCGYVRVSLCVALGCLVIVASAAARVAAAPSAHDEAVRVRTEWSRDILAGLGLTADVDSSGSVTACFPTSGPTGSPGLVVAHSDTLDWPSAGEGTPEARASDPTLMARVSLMSDMQRARLGANADLLFLAGAEAHETLRLGVAYFGADHAFMLDAAVVADRIVASAVEMGYGVPGWTSYQLTAALGAGGGGRLTELVEANIDRYAATMPGRGVGLMLPGGSAAASALFTQPGIPGSGVQRLDLDALLVDAGQPSVHLGDAGDAQASNYSVTIAFASPVAVGACGVADDEPMHGGIRWLADIVARSTQT